MNAFLTSSATDEPTPTTNSRRIPTIIKLQRKNGRVVQGCDVYIGRRCVMGGWNLPQSKWANKNTVRECGSAEMAVKLYREDILNSPDLILDLIELEGKTLGCWCKPGPCHGDILIELFKQYCCGSASQSSSNHTTPKTISTDASTTKQL